MAYRLLLADDSVTIQRVIELTFADEDIEVTAVGNGQQAIERIQAEPPDIILADVDMPERDGFEVAAFVKRTPELAHIPVVLLTGAFEPIDESRVAHAGCDGVLAKPFEPQLLIARVKELLKRTPDARQDRVETDKPPAGVQAGAPSVASGTVALDDYFEQLDVAFANLGTTRPGGATDATDVDSRVAGDQEGEAEAGSWAEPVAPRQPTKMDPQPAPVAPSLVTTFSALLAAEHGQPIPAGALPSLPAASLPLDQIVDEVTRRVLAAAAGQVLREQVAVVVGEIAERLVREEIERLKSTC